MQPKALADLGRVIRGELARFLARLGDIHAGSLALFAKQFKALFAQFAIHTGHPKP